MSDFSLGKALLHAVIVTFLFVAIGRVFAMVEAVPNPNRIGEAGVLALCGVFVVTLAASYGLQSGKAWLLFGGLAVLLVLLGLQVHSFLTLALDKTTFAPAPLTAEEKRRPETRIVEDKLNKKLAKENPNLTQFAYANYETGEQILLIVARDVGKTEGSFRAFAKGVRSAASNDPTIELGDEDFKWADGQGEYTLSAVVNDSAQVEMRCLSRAGGGLASTLVVCAETGTVNGENEDALEKVRNGLRLLPCV
jgi:hypothetical protein